MVESNEQNLIGGLGRDGEEFGYPGHAQDGKGFSRFGTATARGRMLHVLHMSHGVTLDQCDVLMKYLYRGLGPAGKKNEVYQMLLKWHAVVLKRAGHASIMRTIAEVNMAL